MFFTSRPRGLGPKQTKFRNQCIFDRPSSSLSHLIFLALGRPIAQIPLGCPYIPRTRVHHQGLFKYPFIRRASHPLGQGPPPSSRRKHRLPEKAQPQKRSRGSNMKLERDIGWREQSWTYQVVPEKLHNQGRVLVALLAQGVELYRKVLVTCTGLGINELDATNQQ